MKTISSYQVGLPFSLIVVVNYRMIYRYYWVGLYIMKMKITLKILHILNMIENEHFHFNYFLRFKANYNLKWK